MNNKMRRPSWILASLFILVIVGNRCQVASSARITQVSTKLFADYRTNGASLMGGTLVYIHGSGIF